MKHTSKLLSVTYKGFLTNSVVLHDDCWQVKSSQTCQSFSQPDPHQNHSHRVLPEGQSHGTTFLEQCGWTWTRWGVLKNSWRAHCCLHYPRKPANTQTRLVKRWHLKKSLHFLFTTVPSCCISHTPGRWTDSFLVLNKTTTSLFLMCWVKSSSGHATASNSWVWMD